MDAAIDCHNCPGAAHELLPCLIPGQRSRLMNASVPHAYRAHESIFHAGTPALALYCLRSGTIMLVRGLDDGEEFVVGVRGAGAFLGLRGVLAGTRYSATAMTLDPAIVCTIPAGAFLGLVRENSMVGHRLLRGLAREYLLLEEQLVERAHDRVTERIARFVLQQTARLETGASTPPMLGVSMSREEMARCIGTTPETLSRTLHRFAADGILEVDRKEIRVLDRLALLRLSE